MEDKKLYLNADEVAQRPVVKGWIEFQCKVLWARVKDDIVLRNYVPAETLDANYFHDSDWLWGVIYTVKKDWAIKYYEEVLNNRNRSKVSGRPDKVLQLSQEWIDKLAKFDYKS